MASGSWYERDTKLPDLRIHVAACFRLKWRIWQVGWRVMRGLLPNLLQRGTMGMFQRDRRVISLMDNYQTVLEVIYFSLS